MRNSCEHQNLLFLIITFLTKLFFLQIRLLKTVGVMHYTGLFFTMTKSQRMPDLMGGLFYYPAVIGTPIPLQSMKRDHGGFSSNLCLPEDEIKGFCIKVNICNPKDLIPWITSDKFEKMLAVILVPF